MEMSNQACQCPGRKLGHNKTRPTTTTTPVSTQAPATSHDAAKSTGTEQKRIVVPNYARLITPSNENMRGNFKLPGYEPTKLERLPAAPQTLFQKEQLLSMLEDFSKHMYDAIFQNGISVPPSIDLGLNSMGNINVLGNHPDQLSIGSLFSNNSPLAQKFHQIAFTSRVQQLANLQPGFRDEFFGYPTHSIQQITFVQMRAVELQPFRMTIDQPEESTAPTLDKHIPRGEYFPFHLVISRPGETPALSPVAGNQDPTIPDEPIYTIDDPEPQLVAQPEPDKEERRHHEHKGKMRCIINS